MLLFMSEKNKVKSYDYYVHVVGSLGVFLIPSVLLDQGILGLELAENDWGYSF